LVFFLGVGGNWKDPAIEIHGYPGVDGLTSPLEHHGYILEKG